MLEKFGVHISWLGAGGGKVAGKGKVNNPNAMRMEKRNSEGQGGSHDDQLPIVLPQLQLDMALVLVLVQDNNVAINSGAGSSKNRLAPPTSNSKSNSGPGQLKHKEILSNNFIQIVFSLSSEKIQQ